MRTSRVFGVWVLLGGCVGFAPDQPGRPVGQGGGQDADRDGFTVAEGDCDDADAARNPGAAEVCDAADVDEDCDEAADDADPQGADGQVMSWPDADADTYGDATDPGVASCEPPAGRVTEGGDCDDAAVAVHPGADEGCDGRDTDCDGVTPADEAEDVDQDGSPTCADCAPDDAATYPGAPELCDGIASGCPLAEVPADELDADQDGYVACADWVGAAGLSGGDCDDADPDANPSVADDFACDGVDADCDGRAELLVPSVHATIGDAVAAALDGDEVCVEAGTYQENVVITAPVTLTGVDGAAATVIDAGGVGRAVDIVDAEEVTLRGLTLTNGSASGGGGLRAEASAAELTVVLDGVVVAGNESTADGGGIRAVGTELVLVDTVVTDNEATDGGGGLSAARCNCVVGPLLGSVDWIGGELSGNRSWSGDGGGAWLDGPVGTFDGASILDNIADGYGGGLYGTERSDVTLLGGVVERNEGVVAGGGIFVSGPAIVEDVAFTANEAGGSGGGALFVNDVTIVGGSFVGNTSGELGGGVVATGLAYYYYPGPGGLVTMSGTTFTDNVATEAGGGFMGLYTAGSISDVVATGNSSGIGGGFVFAGSFDYTGQPLYVDDAVAIGNVSAYEAGGAYLSDAVLTGGTFEDNVAGGFGGGAYVSGEQVSWTGGHVAGNSASSGGGVSWSYTSGALTDVVIEENVAMDDGGGLRVEDAWALAIDGVELRANEALGAGGGAFVDGDGTATFTTCLVVGNEAGSAGGVSAYRAVLENVVVAGNVAAGDFGGVHVQPEEPQDTGGGGPGFPPEVTVAQSTIVGNTAGRFAPGVYGAASLTGSIVAYNVGTQGAGVLGVDAQTWTDVAGNAPADFTGADPTGANGNLAVDPAFVLYDPALAPTVWDLHLSAASPVVDQGEPGAVDPDGSAADLGAYGGPGAAGW